MSTGLPLLSGPPPTHHSARADIGCRKCSKEFNVLFSRSRKCNHCGYHYCHACSDYQALMPRGGSETGYDQMNVCGYCIEYLSITAAGRGQLKAMPISKLKNYITKYNIKVNRAVEKDDYVDAIISVRGPNGCLPPANENFYRLYSVPDKVPYSRPRGLFSRGGPGPSTSAPPPPPPRPRQPTHDFPRPDLAPDDYPPPPPPRPQQQRPPQPPPQPQSYHQSYHQAPPRSPPRPAYSSRPAGAPAPAPPPRESRPSPQSGFYQRPTASHSSHNLNAGERTTPRPRATSAAPRPPPTPPPTLDDLLQMPIESIRALSIGTLKSILFHNHVNAGLILEKDELVRKVSDLVDDEKRERERQRLAEEQEEQERIELQRRLMEEHERRQREKEEKEKSEQEEKEKKKDGDDSKEASASSSPPPPPPKPVHIERNGLCVVCQDDEANIAIVDCGHLAMCRSCSELIMASSRECPLCRTRIVTEARLLRIFKT